MAGALGLALNEELRGRGLKPRLHFQKATFIPTWASGPELTQFVVDENPDLVLISLGANELQVKDTQRLASRIEKLVAKFNGRACVWVAPPKPQREHNDLLDVIRAHCAPCVYLDTTQLYPDMPLLKDRVHPTMPARVEWARRVADWLERAYQGPSVRPWVWRTPLPSPETVARQSSQASP
jgi:lysophospholipase L1-like esterase